MIIDQVRFEILQAHMIRYLIHKGTNCDKLLPYIQKALRNLVSSDPHQHTIEHMLQTAKKLNKTVTLHEFLKYLDTELSARQAGGGASTIIALNSDAMNDSIYNTAGLITTNNFVNNATVGTEYLLRSPEPTVAGNNNAVELSLEMTNPIIPQAGASYYAVQSGAGNIIHLKGKRKHNNKTK